MKDRATIKSVGKDSSMRALSSIPLNEALARGWTVVDMKQDWKVIFAFEKK